MRQDGEVCRPDRLVRPPQPTTEATAALVTLQPGGQADENEVEGAGAAGSSAPVVVNFTTQPSDEDDAGIVWIFGG